jgi:hypothetical protein
VTQGSFHSFFRSLKNEDEIHIGDEPQFRYDLNSKLSDFR